MKEGVIRPIAICIFRQQDTILVAEGYDAVKGDHFYRPIGGGIEFGETSEETLAREIREELNAAITDLTYLGTVENVFTFNGKTGHEIVRVYDGVFVDKFFNTAETFEGIEDNGASFVVRRLPIHKFQSGELRIVPDGLLDLLTEEDE
ncbi:NUDIX hydrolase [Sporosarcina trichiuri]|uniref:NUDIX hydrolase n=1 Tax=Sporosarcina trichiuri TaxID=3056445 RepID=UPI0025B5836E|nr:NUDIX domain-containing protein [Sporosarcina sp. 0.2-SM1T-5]WJY28297.1 NUDIX domain-containing protein [Sporosarcina sp. 0.2-SM1T-5]